MSKTFKAGLSIAMLALALKVIADRIVHGELEPGILSVQFRAA